MNSNNLEENLIESHDSESLISLTNVEGLLFAPGPIYWLKISGKLVKVADYGNPISKEFLSKFKNLKYKKMINDQLIEEIYDIIHPLEKSLLTPEKIEIRDALAKCIASNYRLEGEASSLIDLIVAFQKVFYDLPEEIENQLLTHSNTLFKRGAIVGTILVTYSIFMGYFDFRLLKDLYHCGFLIDLGFCQDGISTEDFINLDKAQKIESHSDLTSHMKNLDEILKNLDPSFIKNKFIKNLITLHHEKINGKGFPNTINVKEMTDLETLFVFLSNSIPFERLESEIGDGENYFRKLEESTVKDFMAVRIQRFLDDFWLSYEENEKDGFIEITGL